MFERSHHTIMTCQHGPDGRYTREDKSDFHLAPKTVVGPSTETRTTYSKLLRVLRRLRMVSAVSTDHMHAWMQEDCKSCARPLFMHSDVFAASLRLAGSTLRLAAGGSQSPGMRVFGQWVVRDEVRSYARRSEDCDLL